MSSDSTCYTVGDNFVTYTNQYFPCGPSNITGSKAQNCCYAGDYCMKDSICHYTHPVTNGTGYYMGACTDPTWQDPACPKACTSEYGASVVYDAADKIWKCCQSSEGFLDCTDPTTFEVKAPSPKKLQTVKQIDEAVPSLITSGVGAITPVIATVTQSAAISSSSSPDVSSSSTTSPSMTTSVTSSTPSTTSSANDTQSSGGGLSGGAKAGIAIGVIVGVLLIVVAAFFLIRRRKRTKRSAGSVEIASSDQPVAAHYGQDSAAVRSELPSNKGESDMSHEPESPARSQHKYEKPQTPSTQSHVPGMHELSGQEQRHELETPLDGMNK